MDRIFETIKNKIAGKNISDFEVFLKEICHIRAESKNKTIESLLEATDIGLALRVIKKGQCGFSYTTSLSDAAIGNCIDSAVESASNTHRSGAFSFSGKNDFPVIDWFHYDEKIDSLCIEDKIEKALDLESIVRSIDKRIKRVRKSVYEEEKINISIINSEGLNASFTKTLFSSEVIPVATDDSDSQWFWNADFSYKFEDLDIEGVGEKAVIEAISLLGADSIKTTKMPVILHPFVAAQFLKVLCASFYADNIYKEKSALAGKIGQEFYSQKVTIIDNGILRNGYNSIPFDDEGKPRQVNFLVKDGKIEMWLADIHWAEKLSIPSSGSALRKSIKEMPAVSISNVYIKERENSIDDIFKKFDKSLYITEVIGLHTANPITGDFSVGAAGHWVENGTKTFPVKGIMIAGNVHEMFEKIDEVSNDLTFMGPIGSPHLLISSLQVSGK